jgi:hypothetical protein
MEIKHSFYETLSPLFGKHKDMAMYMFLFLDLHVSNFFDTWTFMWPYIFFSSFFSPFPFCNDTGERSLHMKIYLWMDGMEWLTSSVEV